MSAPVGPHSIAYGHEAAERLRVGFVGCGDHAFRNVYPVLRYLPVELVAVCDRQRTVPRLSAARSARCARTTTTGRCSTTRRSTRYWS